VHRLDQRGSSDRSRADHSRLVTWLSAAAGRPFRAALLRSLRAIHRAVPDFRSIVLPGHHHCVLTTPAYNTETVDGVRLRNWVADLVAGRPVHDLGRR
jgi:hypothetical protein